MTWTTRPRSEIGNLAVIAQGSGPLVVLLHGVGLRSEAWGAQIAPLVSSGYRVLCPDMLGHGETRFSEPETLESYVAPVLKFLQEPAVLVGHSMGALIALLIAASGHNRIKGVVALNAVHQRTPEAHQAILQRAESLSADRVNDPTQTLTRWFANQPSTEREACARWLTEVNPKAYKAAYSAFAASNGLTATQLRNIKCPALFMTGGDEPNSTPEMSQRMAGLVPDGRVEIVENAAHMMPMTHPEQVNSALLRFLKEVGHVAA